MIVNTNRLLTAKRCDRCKRELAGRIMSKMNTDILCPNCAETETHHPDYPAAAKAEREELLKGNTNYPGLFAGQKYPFGR